ncbi:MAG: class I SAM-dependent methyltransferase [Dehalococcoidia bacterium]
MAADDYPSTEHFESVATDRTVEEPWAISMVRPGERVLDVGSATSRYLQQLPPGCRVYAIDLRPTRPQPGVAVLRADLTRAPLRPASFDVITCISTIEHIGLDVYGQGPDQFGDEVAMRHMRRLLRPGGRLLLSAPYGRRNVNAWLRIYDEPALRRLTQGYRALSLQYYRRDGDQYLACERDAIASAGFDWANVRSNGVVLAELTPAASPAFLVSRLGLRIRRRLSKQLGRARFWSSPEIES